MTTEAFIMSVTVDSMPIENAFFTRIGSLKIILMHPLTEITVLSFASPQLLVTLTFGFHIYLAACVCICEFAEFYFIFIYFLLDAELCRVIIGTTETDSIIHVLFYDKNSYLLK